MDKTTMTLAFLLGAASAGTITYSVTGKPVEIVADATPSALYDALDAEPKAEIDKAPSKVCTKDGATILGDDREPTKGLWRCGDAIMPGWVQTALDKAAGNVPAVAAEAEAVKP